MSLDLHFTFSHVLIKVTILAMMNPTYIGFGGSSSCPPQRIM